MNFSHITLLGQLSESTTVQLAQCSHFVIDISPPHQHFGLTIDFIVSLVWSGTFSCLPDATIYWQLFYGNIVRSIVQSSIIQSVTLHIITPALWEVRAASLSLGQFYHQTYRTGEITGQAGELDPGTCWTLEIKSGLHYYPTSTAGVFIWLYTTDNNIQQLSSRTVLF